MNKNAIKIEILAVGGKNYQKIQVKTGEFSAILSQKRGEFGDKLDQNRRFLAKNFC